MLSRWLNPAAALSVAALPCLLLAPFVELDPVRGVTFSNAPFSDEAWNLIGARSMALFGHPPTDEWQTWLLTLPFTALQAVAFSLFGVELSVARLVIVAAVAVTGGIITWALTPVVGMRNAWLAGVAYVTSGLVLYYGRLAFLEPLVGTFLAVGVLSVVPASRSAALRWGALGGAALALAVMTKAHALAALLAIMVVVGLAAVSMPWARRWLAGAVGTGSGLAAVWSAAILWPHFDDAMMVVTEIYPQYQWPTGFTTLFRNVTRFPFADGVLWLAWPLLAIAFVGALRIAWCFGRDAWNPDHVAPAAAALGVVAGLGLMSVVDYQPNRYVVAFLPLAAITGAWALPRGRLLRSWRWPTIALATLLIAGQGIVLHVGWLRQGGTEVASIQAAASRHIGSNATVVGHYAPLIALGIPVQAIVPFGDTINERDWYVSGARYAVLPGGRNWVAADPEAWAARKELYCITWSKNAERVCLYELPD